MLKKATLMATLAAALAAAAGGAVYLRSGMDSPEVLRKLAGLRVALELYAMERHTKPGAFGDTISSGQLEGAPDLKLPGHLPAASVRDVASFTVTDSGSWAYVNDKSSPHFGLLFIDCSHRDERGRFWSEF
ncbi:MAG: hypothetical protein ACYC2I_12955 [Elusimicrobiales bacterium]